MTRDAIEYELSMLSFDVIDETMLSPEAHAEHVRREATAETYTQRLIEDSERRACGLESLPYPF